MDKKAWIAVSLSVLGLVLWNYYVASHAPPPRPAAAPGQIAAGAPPAVIEPVRREPVGEQKSTEALPGIVATPAVPERFETLALPGMTLRFTNLGGGIADVTLLGKQHVVAQGQPVKLNASGRLPIGALSDAARPGENAVEPYEMRREGDRSVVFERTTPAGLRITKRFTVQPPPKDAGWLPPLDLEITTANLGPAPFRAEGPYLHAGSAAPIHRADAMEFSEAAFWRDGRLKVNNARSFDAGHVPILGIETSPARPVIVDPVDHLAWVGVKNQFYTTILAPAAPVGKEAAARAVWTHRFPIPPASPAEGQNGAVVYGLDLALGLPALELAPGASATQNVQVYVGPTNYDRLVNLGRAQEELLQYGMFTKPVSVFLLNSMNWLKDRVGSYAVAILLLTILVKIVLLYPQLKAWESTRRMAALSPMIAELKEKYKDDTARIGQEQMKLMNAYGANPMKGCLPVLIQMPIFFGFFRMLGNAAELRNAGFLWASDLTQPDTVARVMGLPINILPLLYAGTMFWQMSLTPKPQDPQQAQQYKIMMFMPVIFVVFFYNFAAALSLYYTMQNLLTIVQLYATRNRPLPVLTKKEPGPGGGGGGGFGGMLAKLAEAGKKDGGGDGPGGGGRTLTPVKGTGIGKGRNGSNGDNPGKGKNGARRVRI